MEHIYIISHLLSKVNSWNYIFDKCTENLQILKYTGYGGSQMENVNKFGERLLKLREERNETQQQLADAIGITRQSLSKTL